MKKRLKQLVAIIILLLVCFVAYRIKTKKHPMEFVKKDTKAILVIDNVSKKNFRELEPLFADFVEKEDVDQLEKNKKYISNIYVFSDSELYEPSIDFVAVVDTGIYYYIALGKWSTYFEKADGVYNIKDDYKEEITNVLPGTETLYADYRNGLFFISNKKDYLKKYLNNEDGKSERIEKIETIIKENKSNLYTFVYNNEDSKEFGLEFTSYTASLKNNIISQNAKIYLNDSLYSFVDYQPNERKLKDLIKKDSLYLSMEDFSKLENILFNQHTLGNLGSGLGFLRFFGIDLKKELQNIDGELLIDFENKKAHILLKDVEITKELIGKFDSGFFRLPDDVVFVDEANKTLMVSWSEFSESSANTNATQVEEATIPLEVYLSRDQFLYAYITHDLLKETRLSENIDESLTNYDITVIGTGRTLELKGNSPLEDLAVVIKNYRERIRK